MDEEGLQDTENKLIHIGKPIEMDEEKFMCQLIQLREAANADSNAIQPGLYTVNYKDKTYKEGGTFGSVEKVLAATIFCNYEKEAGT